MSAKIILGGQFGDEGKGLVTDWLCKPDSIVVRFSGGQQAGHCVIRDGIKHIHSNFGAGTLKGVPTYFSEHCTVYLNSMEIERRALEEKGIKDTDVTLHPLTKLTTPYDLAYGRVREKKLRHGSCGMGVGATMSRHLNTGYKLHAIDLSNIGILKAKLKNINEYYKALCKREENLEEYEKECEADEKFFLENIHKNKLKIADYYTLERFDSLIFEGSQGILLDMDHGVFPHVTYANTTSRNAIDICRKLEMVPQIYYITRCYQTRHGAGWMSSDEEISLINNKEEINVQNDWQGEFRVRELDYDMLNYALDVDSIYSSGCIKHMVVTCMDQRPSFKFDGERINHYITSGIMSYGPTANDIQIVGERRL